MKKICFFMETPFSLGGEQRVTSVIVNYLLNSDYDVFLLLNTEKKYEDFSCYNLDNRVKIIYLKNDFSFFYKIKAFAIKIVKKINYRIPIFKNSLFVLRYFYSLNKRKIISIMNEEKFDYVIGVGSYFFSVLANAKSELQFSKIVAWQHSTFENYFKMKNQRLYNQDAFILFLLSQIDYYVCQTNADKNKLMKNYGVDSRVIENPNTFNEYGVSLKRGKNFLASGRLVFLKGFDMLIDAFYKFSKKNFEWNLYILGEGPEKNSILKKIRDYKLQNRVFLLGKVNNVDEYYSIASICLITSRWEGWGMVATEAMQYGIPIVAFELPSLREIFGDRDCGKLVPLNDTDSFAEAMLILAQDEKLRFKLSDNCLIQSRKFDVEKIGKKWDDIFR